MTASGPPSSIGAAVPFRLDREPHGADEVVDPDRLHALRPGPITGVNGSQPGDAERSAAARLRPCRRRSSGGGRHGRHPTTPTACSAAHFARKYGTVAPGPVPRALISTIAADAALAGGLDEVAGAGRHHALERRRRALDDRDEVDDRAHAPRGGAERRRVGDVAANELAVDAARVPRHRARCAPSPARARRRRPAHATTCRPTNPLAPVTRIIARPGSSASTGSASGRAAPGTSSRAHPTRTASPPARTSARTTAGRSSSPDRS